jgi:hypothetical protein
VSVEESLSNGNVHNNFLMFETSLTGSKNNVPTAPGANSPGLEAAEQLPPEGNRMKKHWLWIVGIILAVLLGLWYFGGKSSAAAA